MITVLSTILIFIAVILLLTIMIITAEKKLVNTGDVQIVINDDEDDPMETPAGGTLLDTLKSNGILLPSACGGQGTCGVCRCKVHEGGGDILATEKNHISRREARQGERLACQVKVKQDMRIEVPDEVFKIDEWECEVIKNDFVATYIKEFVVRLPKGENLDFKPGGYVQIKIPRYEIDFRRDMEVPKEYRDEWDEFGLFDLHHKNTMEIEKAYSMANHPAEGNIVMLNVRIATPPWDRKKNTFQKVPPGVASTYIFSLKPGDRVNISGPYGEFFIQDTDREMVYIGGGAGMAPLRSHIFHLFHTLKTGRRVSYWYGARSKREIFYEKEFRDIEKKFKNFSFHVALSDPLPEDKWKGPVGFIHQVVYDEYLKHHPEPEEIEYYLCGPGVMTDAVDEMLYNLGVEQEMIRYDKFN
jgi:Na+-transporting NADH:ubiquinone oxidoreductase subunit F